MPSKFYFIVNFGNWNTVLDLDDYLVLDGGWNGSGWTRYFAVGLILY